MVSVEDLSPSYDDMLATLKNGESQNECSCIQFLEIKFDFCYFWHVMKGLVPGAVPGVSRHIISGGDLRKESIVGTSTASI